MRWCITPHHFNRWNQRRRSKRYIVVLVIGSFAVELIKGDRIIMATTIKVGQTLPMSIEFLDSNGNVVSPPPATDTAPQWSQNDSSVGTLSQSSDGMSAQEIGLAAGNDVISLDLVIGGKTFDATLDLTVEAVASQVASIRIVPGTPTP